MPAKRKYTKKKKKPINPELKKYIAIIIFVFFWVLAIITDPTKTVWAYLKIWLTYTFWEYYKLIFSPVLLILSIYLIREKDIEFNLYRFFWLLFYFSSLTTLVWYFNENTASALFNFYPLLSNQLWSWATLFSFFVLFLWSLVILFRFNPLVFFQFILSLLPWLWDLRDTIKAETSRESTTRTKKELKMSKQQEELDEMMLKLKEEKQKLKQEKQTNQLNINDAPKKIKVEKKSKWLIWGLLNKPNEKKESVKIARNPEFKNWQFPQLEILEERNWKVVIDENEIRRREIEIEEKLLQFRIKVEMIGYQVWPTVIQYRLKPKAWVALRKIENLKKDLALALHAKSIRIQAPIPWLGLVGIEVPNSNRQSVWLKEVLASRSFNSKKMEIPVALGKDVSWNIVVWDLAKMPHLLVAWQTWSGKSVWMNWFLVSMLYKFSPSELKMIMVDPKRVELSVYNGIPHLLTPVITNADKALNALKWCVTEMLRRYDLAASVNARNLKEYNSKVSKEEKLPYIVMVVDELADLMMSWNKKEVEQSISRIAQMARAVWMHLIIATQRPSVDVITWLIKANIPSRIAFTVATQVDSQTVLGKKWAEDLLGRWDMLYYPSGAIDSERVQWVLVETHEVEAVVNKLKLTVDPDMIDNLQIPEIVNGKSKLEWSIMENYQWDQEEDPEVIEKAIQIVKEAKKWSTSLIQRKIWLWYARAAKVLDILEELWVVWPANGSKPREVYVD